MAIATEPELWQAFIIGDFSAAFKLGILPYYTEKFQDEDDPEKEIEEYFPICIVKIDDTFVIRMEDYFQDDKYYDALDIMITGDIVETVVPYGGKCKTEFAFPKHHEIANSPEFDCIDGCIFENEIKDFALGYETAKKLAPMEK